MATEADRRKAVADEQKVANRALREGNDLTKVMGQLLNENLKVAKKVNQELKDKAETINVQMKAQGDLLKTSAKLKALDDRSAEIQQKIADGRDKQGKFTQGYNIHVLKGYKTQLDGLAASRAQVKEEQIRRDVALDAAQAMINGLEKVKGVISKIPIFGQSIADGLGLSDDNIQKLQKNLVKVVSGSMNFSDIMEGVDDIDFKKIAGLAAGIGLAVGLTAAIVKSATKFSELTDNIGEQFGSLNVLGSDLQNSLNASTVEAQKLGFNQAEVLSTTSTLSSEFGISLEQASALSGEIMKTAKATGLSVDEATKLTGELRVVAGLSQEQSEALIEGTAQLARQAGVAPQQVLKDIAGSSETIATFTKGTGENLFEAAIQARQFGLNIDSVAKAARSSLDFESSINAELEASTLLGQQINLQRARQLALDKDLVGFQKEIKNQLGDIGDFSKLNVFQQEALAKSVGMSVGEVAKLVSGTEKLSVAGALSAGNFDDLAGQEALSNLSKITNELKSLFTEALLLIGPEIDNIVGGFKTFLEESGGVTFLKDAFMSVANAIKLVIQYGPALVTMLAGIKAASLTMALAQTISAIAGSAAATPFLLGGGAVIAAGVIGATIAAAASMIPSFDNLGVGEGALVKGSPQTKALMQAQGGEMLIQKESLDGAGINVNALVEAQKETTRAITELTLTAGRGEIRVAMEPQFGGEL